MAVRIICDVCDELSDPDTWAGLTMTIPGELLGTFSGEELEIHVCSWKCVYILADSKLPSTDELSTVVGEDEPEKFQGPMIDREALQAELERSQSAYEEKTNKIAWGNNPNAGLKQPDAEVPMEGVTKDRQTIRLKRA
jgi:hypothetical protein